MLNQSTVAASIYRSFRRERSQGGFRIEMSRNFEECVLADMSSELLMSTHVLRFAQIDFENG